MQNPTKDKFIPAVILDYINGLKTHDVGRVAAPRELSGSHPASGPLLRLSSARHSGSWNKSVFRCRRYKPLQFLNLNALYSRFSIFCPNAISCALVRFLARSDSAPTRFASR